jgi:hypothetical protein
MVVMIFRQKSIKSITHEVTNVTFYGLSFRIRLNDLSAIPK